MVCFGGNQQSVNKTGRRAWQHDTGNNVKPVNIRSNYMRRFREVDRLSYDVIFTGGDSKNYPGILAFREIELHMIANSHRIGCTESVNPKLPFEPAIENLSVIGYYSVPASC